MCARARLKKPGSNSDSNNPESSLDDSGVVDDHEGGDVTSEETPAQLAAKHQVRYSFHHVRFTCLFESEHIVQRKFMLTIKNLLYDAAFFHL